MALGAVRAVEGTHWLLCADGRVVAALHVRLGPLTELAAYVAALLVRHVESAVIFPAAEPRRTSLRATPHGRLWAA